MIPATVAPEESSPTDPSDSIRRNTAFALAMRVVSAVFTGGLVLFLVRYLGPDEYGEYALALSVGGLLLLPMDFGVSRSAARFIAERRGRTSEVAGVLRQALGLKAAGAGLGAVLLVALADPIASAYGEPDLVWPLRVVALAIFAQSFMLLFTVTFEGLGRNSLGFQLALSESAVEATASVSLVLAGAGVVGALVGRAIAYCLAAALGLLLAKRVLGRNRLRGATAGELSIRRIAAYAGAMLVIDAAFAAFGYIDVLLIGAILDARSAGIFSAPAQLLIFAQYGGLALAAGVGPRLAWGREQGPDVSSFQAGLRLLLALQFLLVAPILVWAGPITHLLFGAGYSSSADVLRTLAPFAVMVGPTPMLALGINYLGEARRRVPLAIGAVAINAAIDALLISRIGVIAGAIGTDVAFLFFCAGHVMIARTVVGLRLRPLAMTALRALLAAAAMAAVMFAFGTSSLTAVEAIAGSLLGLSAYAAVLLAAREFSGRELRAAWNAVRGLAGAGIA
jgi:O-antigen/teichoic acid export membrane protein